MAVICKKNAVGLVVGAAAAAAVTLMFVPQEGRKLRRSIWRKAKALVGR